MKTKKCASDICEVSFIPEYDSQIYCCDNCREYMRKKQKRDWYKRSKLDDKADMQLMSRNVKTNCFAWNDEKKSCEALSNVECLRGSCSFFKPIERHLEDVRKAKRRLANK